MGWRVIDEYERHAAGAEPTNLNDASPCAGVRANVHGPMHGIVPGAY